MCLRYSYTGTQFLFENKLRFRPYHQVLQADIRINGSGGGTELSDCAKSSSPRKCALITNKYTYTYLHCSFRLNHNTLAVVSHSRLPFLRRQTYKDKTMSHMPISRAEISWTSSATRFAYY